MLDPPVSLYFVKEHKARVLPFEVLSIDCIWKWINKAVHKGVVPSKSQIMRSLYKLVQEHQVIYDSKSLLELLEVVVYSWSKPRQDFLKVNCHAAIGDKFSCIAVVRLDREVDICPFK